MSPARTKPSSAKSGATHLSDLKPLPAQASTPFSTPPSTPPLRTSPGGAEVITDTLGARTFHTPQPLSVPRIDGDLIMKNWEEEEEEQEEAGETEPGKQPIIGHGEYYTTADAVAAAAAAGDKKAEFLPSMKLLSSPEKLIMMTENLNKSEINQGGDSLFDSSSSVPNGTTTTVQGPISGAEQTKMERDKEKEIGYENLGCKVGTPLIQTLSSITTTTSSSNSSSNVVQDVSTMEGPHDFKKERIDAAHIKIANVEDGKLWKVVIDCCGAFCGSADAKDLQPKDEIQSLLKGSGTDITANLIREFEDRRAKRSIGNYRMQSGDKLMFLVVAGTFKYSTVREVRVVDPLGHETTLTGSLDKLGNWHLLWSPPSAAVAGPYTFQVKTKAASGIEAIEGVRNIITVEPKLTINGQTLQTEAIKVQTVLSRCLGPLSRWKKMMKSPSELGFNMVHFTPIQSPGESGSCYSISDQLEVSSYFFQEGGNSPSSCLPPAQRMKDVEKTLKELEVEYGMLSSTDIVLNHTAASSQWIREHPECGYSVENSPHLAAAIELDNAIKEFSDNMVAKKFEKDFGGLREYIVNEQDLGRMLWAFRESCLKEFKMYEWFQLDILQSIADWEGNPSEQQGNFSHDHAKHLLMEHAKELIGTVRGPHMVLSNEVSRSVCFTEQQLHDVLHHIQEDLYRMATESENAVLSALEGNVRYERLECQKGPVGNEHWEALLPRYFTPVETVDGNVVHLANNGWVMGWDVTNDFSGKGSLVYLRRQLVVWSDCVKLRYGDGPTDIPYLWKRMEKYCEDSARAFHAIRLDNCHSTPIHVAKHMLQACRRVRPSVWIYAELFTGEQKSDLMFERELGLNALIREAMQTHDTYDLVAHAKQYCQNRPVGLLSDLASIKREGGVATLRPTLCPALFFDCTHDNKTPTEKRTATDALSTAAIVCASTCAIGSTRGFDELVPKQLNVVTENRLYQDYQHSSSQYSSSTVSSLPSNESSDKSVELCWPSSTSGTVAVRGDWDGWKEDVPCVKQADGTFKVELRVGQQLREDTQEYQFKYIVDGEWCYDNDQPCAKDSFGNINNVFSIHGSKPEAAKAWQPGESLPGLMEARRVLNELHSEMAELGYSEISLETLSEDMVLIQRHNPTTHGCVYFLIRSAFQLDRIDCTKSHVREIAIPARIDRLLMLAHLRVLGSPKSFVDDAVKINGLPSVLQLHLTSTDMVHFGSFDYDQHMTKIYIQEFSPGSVMVISTFGYAEEKAEIDECLGGKAEGCINDLNKACESLDLEAISYLLYSCENEEKQLTGGLRGCYDVPNHGPLVYCGFMGSAAVLDAIRTDPAKCLAHPICDNFRGGTWILQYYADRMKDKKFHNDAVSVGDLEQWLRALCDKLETIRESPNVEVSGDGDAGISPSTVSSTALPSYRVTPKLPPNASRGLVQRLSLEGEVKRAGAGLSYWLRPYYVDKVISVLICRLKHRALQLMSPFVRENVADDFVMNLVMSSLQFYSFVPNGSIEGGTNKPSLCAGLPHFSTGFMRNWGRDTFISLRGILLATGRFGDARREILGYARVVRHGLVPNLVDGGYNPRFNARDATWFFLQAVQDYCRVAPEGNGLLKAPVELKYPVEDGEPDVRNLGDLVHYILHKHAKGIKFRELNAGITIDEHMTSEGFNIEIRTDPNTGILYGGSEFNCGTWMDKMGSSAKAGNKGIPATPRDGAAIEIVGLLKSALQFVTKLPESVFPYKHATDELSYNEWNRKIQDNFEKLFYVPDDNIEPEEGEFNLEKKFVNRKGIFKDLHMATHRWCDYQLRPNGCVALVVAAELFTNNRASNYLANVHEHLWGARQLGLKTLDPNDFNFRGDYDNANDTCDKHIAHGWNYHQGPEWLWPLGYFLQAKYLMSEDKDTAKQECMSYLINHRSHIERSLWRSLPELTNQDGRDCYFSCPSQAWSVGTVMSFLHTIALQK